jgi:hypothetical protein
MTKLLRAALALCLVVLTAACAGCGSSSGGSGSDTAKLAPPSSFLYAEATIDPSGDQESAMRSILGDLPGEGAPQARLDNLLEQASKSAKDSKVDYLKDVKPWLGDKIAAFVSQGKAGSTKPPAALLVATTDEAKAQDTIDSAKESGDHNVSYRDTDYVLSKDGSAVALLDGFFVAGSEAGMKAAIDASKDQSLSETDSYKQAIEKADDNRVALVYEDLGGIVNAVVGASGQSLGAAAPFLGRILGGKPVVATIRAEQQALVIDGSLIPTGALGDVVGKSTPLLGEVPGDSWLALGAADFGSSLEQIIGLFAGALGGEQALEQQLQAATGLDLERDVLSWMGDVALFAGGDSKDTLGGGAVIESKDAAASKAALTRFAALAANTGGADVAAAQVGKASGYSVKFESATDPVYLLQMGDRVAVTYGEGAAKAALGGATGLADSAGFKSAGEKLGAAYTPSLYVTAAPILQLAESFGAGGADYGKAKPYLTILDYLIAGGAQAGDTAKSRVRIGFKPHE